jgi:hypothetical protein
LRKAQQVEHGRGHVSQAAANVEVSFALAQDQER